MIPQTLDLPLSCYLMINVIGIKIFKIIYYAHMALYCMFMSEKRNVLSQNIQQYQIHGMRHNLKVM